LNKAKGDIKTKEKILNTVKEALLKGKNKKELVKKLKRKGISDEKILDNFSKAKKSIANDIKLLKKLREVLELKGKIDEQEIKSKVEEYIEEHIEKELRLGFTEEAIKQKLISFGLSQKNILKIIKKLKGV